MEIITDAKKLAEQVGYDYDTGLHADGPVTSKEHHIPEERKFFLCLYKFWLR